jgi:glycerol-3-phosphate acyltransferase PlsY
VLLGVHWPAALLFCLVWALMAAGWRYSSLAALTATVAVVLYYLVTGWAGWTGFNFILIMSALIFLKHNANIRRLLEGRENRIGERA